MILPEANQWSGWLTEGNEVFFSEIGTLPTIFVVFVSFCRKVGRLTILPVQ